jgi:hypothetical protein
MAAVPAGLDFRDAQEAGSVAWPAALGYGEDASSGADVLRRYRAHFRPPDAGELFAIHKFNSMILTSKFNVWRGIQNGRSFPNSPWLEKAIERALGQLPSNQRWAP